MRSIVTAFVVFILTSISALAQQAMPADRFIYARDTDFPGSDLSSLFDTTREACERACRADTACIAMTFNERSGACFTKSAVTGTSPYTGAWSARREITDPAAMARASERARELEVISNNDLAQAIALVDTLAHRYPADGLVPAELSSEYIEAFQNKNYSNARAWAGFLASASDTQRGWTAYANSAMRLPDSVPRSERRQADREALSAAINGVLRAQNDADEAFALLIFAYALDQNNRGRDMIPVLRRASAISDRQDVERELDKAIEKYGFRIVDHTVENESSTPRICAEFSEDLQEQGTDYEPFVRVRGATVTVEPKGRQLCIDGLEHGARYEVTFREGLPAVSGERTARSVDLTLYVKDRTAQVRFPGRAYVLPRLSGAALPVETVNLSELDLKLRKVSDRNLLRSIQDSYFGEPMSRSADRRFAETIGADIWSGTATVGNELNTEMTTRLPLDDMLAGQDPGIYVLRASVPDGDPWESPDASQWFVLSDLGVSTIKGTDGFHVEVRALSTAGGVGGASVQLVSQANVVLATEVTGEDGYARFDAGLARGTGADTPALLVVETDTDMAFLPLSGPAFDLSDRGVEGRIAPGPLDVFLATDRGAYRAGETIGVTALVRDPRVSAVSGLPLQAVLFRPDGAEYARVITDQKAAGGHVFQLPIAPDVPRGAWRLDIKLGEDTTPLASQTVLVEDFVPERLDFTLSLPDAPLDLMKQETLEVEARYLFGAPASDLPVAARVRLSPTRTLEEWPGFRFGAYDQVPRARLEGLEISRTDASGIANLLMQFPEMDAEGYPLKATIIAEVSEGSGRPVERTLDKPVTPTTSLIGIKPGFEDAAPSQGEVTFEIIALDPSGAVLDGADFTWTLNKVSQRYQWYSRYGNWEWEPVTRRTRIATETARLGSAPLSISVPVDWGRYELIAVLGDGRAVGSVDFYAGWYGSGDTTTTPDRLEVGLNRDSYAPGDTAELRIVTEVGGTALVTVMASDLIHREVVDISAGGGRVPLQVTDAWGTGAYVSASLIRPVTEADGLNPTRALGIAHAKVDPGEKALQVSIDAPTETDGQEGTTEVTIRVDGQGGEAAHITLAAVDLGILNLTAHDAPDPSDHYFGQRRLGIELRDLYGRLIDGQSGALGQVRSGGDAAARTKMQSPPPTEAPMVFFSGLVPVGADGTARISVPRPAFNGTIRLDAIAWTETAVGQASEEMLARDPVVLTASVPRFLSPGDQSELRFDFVQTRGTGGDLPLQVTAPGLTLGPVPASVSVTPGETSRVVIPLRANASGDFSINVAMTLPDGQILSKTLAIGVRRNDPETSTTRRFTLDPGQTFTFDGEVFAGMTSGSGDAVLTAGPLARFDMPGLIDQLDRYPYGCTEQLTSVAMPLLYLSGFSSQNDVDSRIDHAIARVLNRQSSNGSFGLWSASDTGYYWLDAYVTDFLTRARDQGHSVPDLPLRLALDNLQNRVNYISDFDEGGEALAYAMLILSREGRASMADMRYFVDVKREAFTTALAAAQMGAALANYGDSIRADQMFARADQLLRRNETDERVWRVDYGTNISDSAAVLRLASDAGSGVIDRDALARRLVADRSLSTQEAAQVLLAINALRDEPGSSGISVDGVPASGPVVERLANMSDLSASEIRNTGQSATDVTLTVFGIPEIPPQATGYGYAISRAYFRPDGTPFEGDAQSGEQLVVVLTIEPFEPTGARLMIDDPLPAGLEIDNPNLIQAGQITGLAWLEPAAPQNAEFLVDRFRAAIDVNGTDPVRVAYKVRAVSPGDYHHPAALVHDMYRPEYRAITATGRWVTQP